MTSKILPYVIGVVALIASGFALYAVHQVPTTTFGATANPSANALYEQSLAQPLGTTDANMYVTSGADVQGNLLPVSSYQCLTVDTGQPTAETICGTVSASSASGLTLAITLRGVNTQTGTTTNAAFVFTHRRGADVRITDFPSLTIINNQLSGTQTIPGPIYYSSNFTPSFWSTAASNTITTLGYVNSSVASGCGAGSTIASGCFQAATARQAASSTVLGSSGFNDILLSSYATDTPSTSGCATASGGCVVMSLLNGKLNQAWLDLTQAFTVTGLWTFNNGFIDNASSTFTSTVNLNGNTFFNGTPASPKFGGNGALGALSISSGTTTISLANAKYAEFDYTSISITGTGNLTFSNPASGGSFVVLRSQGNVTITCTDQFCIDVAGLGGGGGAGGGSGATSGSTGTGGNAFFLFTTSGGAAGASGGGTPAGGATPTAIAPSSWLSSNYATSTLMKYGGQFWVGAGGGGGGTGNASNNAQQGNGGAGAGSLLMEVGGALNFTATNGINAQGANGTNPTNTTYGGAGGGGAGGLVKVLYNTLTANTGTIVVNGGTGGTGGSNSNASCGAGGGTAYTAGSAGATGSSCTGGAGANGASSVELNTNYY